MKEHIGFTGTMETGQGKLKGEVVMSDAGVTLNMTDEEGSSIKVNGKDLDKVKKISGYLLTFIRVHDIGGA